MCLILLLVLMLLSLLLLSFFFFFGVAAGDCYVWVVDMIVVVYVVTRYVGIVVHAADVDVVVV